MICPVKCSKCKYRRPQNEQGKSQRHLDGKIYALISYTNDKFSDIKRQKRVA